MARYLVLWSANPGVWPTDPKQALGVVEAAAAGGDHLLRSGGITEMGWLTAQDGYAIFEAGSKDQVLGMVHSFYPFYRQEIHEIVPWEPGKQAILASARQAASRAMPEAAAR